MMYGGGMAFSGRDARDVLEFFSGFAAEAPDELNTDCAVLAAPDGGLMLAFDVCYSGPLERAESVIAPLRGYRKTVMDKLGVAPYVVLQTRGDAANAPGRGYYERSGFVRHIDPALIDTVLGIMHEPHPESAEIAFVHHGAAIARVKPEATAFWNRGAGHTVLINTDWDDPHDARARDQRVSWARQAWARIEPFTRGFYVNTMAVDDPQHRVRTTYGGNYSRMVQLKERYDPTNLFRLNANVPPGKLAAGS